MFETVSKATKYQCQFSYNVAPLHAEECKAFQADKTDVVNCLSFTLQATLNILDVGMQEALQDVYSKTLKKLLTQAMPVPEEIDDSLLL